MMYLIRFRPFKIKDVAAARLSKPFEQTYNRLVQPFENDNLMIDLKEEDEVWFVKNAVQTHPEYVKDFGHVLIDPPNNILPSDVYRSVHNRDERIPTLCAVVVIDGEVQEIHKIVGHKQLFDTLYRAATKGWVDKKSSYKLLGVSYKKEIDVV